MQLTQAQFATNEKRFAESSQRELTVEQEAHDYKVSESAIVRWRRKYRKVRAKKAKPKTVLSRCALHQVKDRDRDEMLRAWKRPEGIDEHLEMLRE
jgi:hypothetical protein